MADQEPLDLVIMLKIVEYVSSRRDSLGGSGAVDGDLILNIINNMAPGSRFGVQLSNDTINQETTMGDHYRVDGQAGAVGREAKAESNTFNQIKASAPTDLSTLAVELQSLRAALRERATTPDEDVAVAAVAQAMVAAEDGSDKDVQSHLKQAGRWALGVATTIGTTVAAGAIRSALGM